jgi:hypothetical protein
VNAHWCGSCRTMYSHQQPVNHSFSVTSYLIKDATWSTGETKKIKINISKIRGSRIATEKKVKEQINVSESIEHVIPPTHIGDLPANNICRCTGSMRRPDNKPHFSCVNVEVREFIHQYIEIQPGARLKVSHLTDRIRAAYPNVALPEAREDLSNRFCRIRSDGTSYIGIAFR